MPANKFQQRPGQTRNCHLLVRSVSGRLVMVQPVVTRPLITFAYIKDTFDQTGDIALGLMPLFEPIMSRHVDEVFDPNVFSAEVNRFYGLRISPLAAEALAPRLAAAKLLREEPEPGGLVKYFNVRVNATTPDVYSRPIESLLAEFVKWATDKLAARNIAIPKEELEDAFLHRLSTPTSTPRSPPRIRGRHPIIFLLLQPTNIQRRWMYSSLPSFTMRLN
jgi:hypothetical protein